MSPSETGFPRYVAIEGPIGVGKTTLAVKLSKQLQARLVLEEFTDNPFLTEFYRDRQRVAFQTQVYFLIARYKQQERLRQQDLFSRAVVSDYVFAKDRIFAYLNLSEAELQLYEKIYELIRPTLLTPDLVVYLQARPEVLMQRLRGRGRDFESTIEVEYLENLMRGYNNFFFHYEESPLLVVETSDIDIVNNPQDFDDLVAVIRRTKKGTNHYIPQPRGVR
ncbi:MAG: deoxyadenosine kinase [Deltaproteobacteria bacterium RIFOXYA12_FULL_58_15]|nr:MAG: deoxyadenosine kinase [Deltaproteobacteria bacterium RIFOXYA12_FULL_58_15]OGR09368.1 MAG: deoxyadenosine kinase [Deltaproteobacteria bacterium RIFOXYB12_FULL_58_9]